MQIDQYDSVNLSLSIPIASFQNNLVDAKFLVYNSDFTDVNPLNDTVSAVFIQTNVGNTLMQDGIRINHSALNEGRLQFNQEFPLDAQIFVFDLLGKLIWQGNNVNNATLAEGSNIVRVVQNGRILFTESISWINCQ